ncbi:MAG TPA: site-2 protease family protein [Deltaproteobacteria bacterium]|nr:site-2 protease family protein [Deltaproteobacteria bacterium]
MISSYIQEIALLAVPVLFSITFHEVSHGYAAFRLGDPTARNAGRLTLNPISHIDPVGLLVLVVTRMIGWAKPVPVDPRYFKNPRQDMMWVSLAGPASNLLLAVVFAVISRVVPPIAPSSFLYPLAIMLQFMIVINVGLAVFNLIPIPPLDGSHILQGLLPYEMARSYSKIEPYGFIILLVLVFTRTVNVVIFPVIDFITGLLMRI